MSGSDEYEYEESTLMVELQGIMEADFLSNVKQAKVLGVDTEKPLLQLDDYTFTGEYQDVMGTVMVFDELPQQHDATVDGEERKKLQFQCVTNKKLCMQRVFLKKTEEPTVPVTLQHPVDKNSQPGSSTSPNKEPTTETTDMPSKEPTKETTKINVPSKEPTPETSNMAHTVENT